MGGGWDMGDVACFLLLIRIHKKCSYVKGHTVQHKEMKHAPKKSLHKCQTKIISMADQILTVHNITKLCRLFP